MQDLELARKVFEEEELALVLVRRGQVLAASSGTRLLPLFLTLETKGGEAAGSSLADRVIGRAAAFLLCQAGVSAVYTPLIASSAKELLERRGVRVVFEREVPVILDQTGERPCPMERLVEGVQEPDTGYQVLKDFFRDKLSRANERSGRG